MNAWYQLIGLLPFEWAHYVFMKNALLAILLFAQVGLGIANVVMSLPLHVAVLHNAGATALLFVLVSLLARVRAPDA